MSWQAVASKDFQDAIRSRWLWALSTVFVLLYTVPVYLVSREIGIAAEEVATNPDRAELAAVLTSDLIVQGTVWLGAHFIPVIAIVIAYASIAGERDVGTVKMLLALPHSRRDVIIGKLVGRGAVLTVPISLGFALSAIAIALTQIHFEPLTYLLYAGLTVLLGLVWVAIAIGISAAVRTGRQAMVGTVGAYAVFAVLWGAFTDGIEQLLREYGWFGAETLMQVQLGLLLLNPIEAYRTLVTSISVDTTLFGDDVSAELLARQDILSGRNTYYLLEGVPAYFSDQAVLAILCIWLLAVPVLGYRTFARADL